ncbi:MAG: DUF2721 domain-containing protein [Pseudomonadota bacterium]
MIDPSPSPAIGEVIQLALAPVFVLVAIGSFLNVLAMRLARAVDRAREVMTVLEDDPADALRWTLELESLGRRMKYSHLAINCCAVAALIVALLVVAMFLADLAHLSAAGVIALLFSAAMIIFVAALCFFLAEIAIAARTVRVGAEMMNK